GHELVEADPLDEGGPRVDQRHGHVVAAGQAVGRHHAGVAAADHDHSGVLSHGVALSSVRVRPYDTDRPPGVTGRRLDGGLLPAGDQRRAAYRSGRTPRPPRRGKTTASRRATLEPAPDRPPTAGGPPCAPKP